LVDVQADAAGSIGEEILVGSSSAVDVEDVTRANRGEYSREVVDEVAKVEIEIVGSARMPTRAPDFLDGSCGDWLSGRSIYAERRRR
jgi:hypothetical protein